MTFVFLINESISTSDSNRSNSNELIELKLTWNVALTMLIYWIQLFRSIAFSLSLVFDSKSAEAMLNNRCSCFSIVHPVFPLLIVLLLSVNTNWDVFFNLHDMTFSWLLLSSSSNLQFFAILHWISSDIE